METSRRGMGMVGSRQDKTTTTAAISTVPSADTQKLDFILETLQDQKNLVETLGSDINVLKLKSLCSMKNSISIKPVVLYHRRGECQMKFQ